MQCVLSFFFVNCQFLNTCVCPYLLSLFHVFVLTYCLYTLIHLPNCLCSLILVFVLTYCLCSLFRVFVLTYCLYTLIRLPNYRCSLIPLCLSELIMCVICPFLCFYYFLLLFVCTEDGRMMLSVYVLCPAISCTSDILFLVHCTNCTLYSILLLDFQCTLTPAILFVFL